MNPRHIFAGAIALVLTVGGLAGWYVHRLMAEPGVTLTGYPEESLTRIEVHPGEIVRHVELYEDGITPRHAVADNVDGTISNFWFRKDATLERATTEGPVDELTGRRPLLREARVAEDGATYILDVEYFESGARAKVARLTDAKTTSRVYFFEDGDIRRNQIISLDSVGWKLTFEDVFRDDGTLAHIMRSRESGGWHMKDFGLDGQTIVAVKALLAVGDTYPTGLTTRPAFLDGASASARKYVEIDYLEDGKTILRTLEQTQKYTETASWQPDGDQIERRKWNGPVDQGSMEVYVFDWQGRLVFDQWWNWDNNTRQYRLWIVKEYRQDGTQWHYVSYNSDQTIAVEILYEGDGRDGVGVAGKFLRRWFHPDGSVKKEEDSNNNKTLATREFPPGNDRRLVIAPDRLVLAPYKAPPTVVEFVPSRGPY